MKLTKQEQGLIKEALLEKYKRQTDLLNRKIRGDNDPVLIKWRELMDLWDRFDKS